MKALYLHGFASSPGSTKARAFARWAEERGLPLEVLDLRVPSFEGLLISAMKARVLEHITDDVVLIGSSLGGLTAARVAADEPRVRGLFLMAPAFQLATRWADRIGAEAWRRWKESGFIEVEDQALKRKAKVHFGFVEELARIDAERGPWPDVRVPTCIIHGTRDDIVDVELSREWATGKPHVKLVEVDDGHELSQSLSVILREADRHFAQFIPHAAARRPEGAR